MQYLVGRWRLKWFRLHFRLYLESCIGFRDQPKHSLVGEVLSRESEAQTSKPTLELACNF